MSYTNLSLEEKSDLIHKYKKNIHKHIEDKYDVYGNIDEEINNYIAEEYIAYNKVNKNSSLDSDMEINLQLIALQKFLDNLLSRETMIEASGDLLSLLGIPSFNKY